MLVLLALASCHKTNQPVQTVSLALVTSPTAWMPPSLGGEFLGVNNSLILSCSTCLHNIRTSVSIQSPRVLRAAVLVGGLAGLTFKEKKHSNQIMLLGFLAISRHSYLRKRRCLGPQQPIRSLLWCRLCLDGPALQPLCFLSTIALGPRATHQ